MISQLSTPKEMKSWEKGNSWGCFIHNKVKNLAQLSCDFPTFNSDRKLDKDTKVGFIFINQKVEDLSQLLSDYPTFNSAKLGKWAKVGFILYLQESWETSYKLGPMYLNLILEKLEKDAKVGIMNDFQNTKCWTLIRNNP